ncbi:MAG: polyphosphate kinase 2 family protein [Dehalococcoidia bacterium]
MSADAWRIPPGSEVSLAQFPTADTSGFEDKDQATAVMSADIERLRDLQELFYADGRFAVLLVLQGMDTSGKDGTVKHLSSGISLVGAEMTNFKAPSERELAHDFLWRVHQHAPERGRIGIFNRSHYEDVLVVRVHNLVPRDVWESRYEQINAFERILTLNHTIVIKCFLHISNDEQKERLLARLDNPAKHWKFNPGDLKERSYWDAYQQAYEAALSRCNTADAPWYIIPADKKWHRNYAVTRILVETLERLDLRPPTPDFDPQAMRAELSSRRAGCNR